jgi:hypothetical protein
MTRAVWAVLVAGAIATPLVERVQAQTPARGAAVAAPAAAPPPPVQGNLAQLMKGAFYPAANVVFAAQDLNPAEVPRAKDPNMATDLLTSSFGKWEAVENSALALSAFANLLTVPGLKCANGLEVPLKNPDWAKFAQQLREAGMAAYAAARTKDQDKMIEVSDVMTKACANCHVKYRQKANPADRCK